MNRKMRRFFAIIGLIGLMMVLILYAGGFLNSGKIEPGLVTDRSESASEPKAVARSGRQMVAEWFEAVGTVRPRVETNIEAQVTGRINEVLVHPGMDVQAGQRLVVLDNREFQARLDQAVHMLESAKARRDQARQAVVAARAEFERAQAEYQRFQRLFKSRTISSRDLERVKASYLSALAGLKRAQDGLPEAEAAILQADKLLEEAEIASTYTEIKALESGQVVKRLVEPGDLAWPGKPLLILQTSQSLRLEALVREGLIHRVRPGTRLKVAIDSVPVTLDGMVEELVPSADPQTRTFLVKVAFENRPDLYPGMFGRLLIPVGEREVVVAPRAAIQRIGQLELVRIKSGGRWRDSFVRSGQVWGDQVEILSGLNGGETIALAADGNGDQ